MTDNLTVFIVDDDPSVRDALGLLLGIHDYRVAMFADADSYLRAFKPHWRGCLLLDIRMPGMDGLTLQRTLLDQGASLPVVIMTGHGDVDSARAAFRAQAVDFLEKPIDEGRLLAAIGDVIERHMIDIGFLPDSKTAREEPDLVAEPKQVVNLGESRLRHCPKCNQPSLVRSEGCDSCLSCGYSKCG